MANLLHDNPWTLDTPGAAVLFFTYIKVRQFEWQDFAAGNSVIVQDQNGKEVWKATAPATVSESVVRSGNVGWINGLILNTLGGTSKLKVYIE